MDEINLDKQSDNDQLAQANPYANTQQPPLPPQYQGYSQGQQPPYPQQYAQPGYAPQQYAQPGYQPNMYYAPATGVNALAVTSFVVAVGGALLAILLQQVQLWGYTGTVLTLLLFIPVGIVTGIIALSQIKHRGGQGKGFAVAGIVISSLAIVVIVLLMLLGLLLVLSLAGAAG